MFGVWEPIKESWEKNKNQPPMGDPHKLQRGGPCVIRHEAAGLVTDHAPTTSLELVWISHGRLVLIIILVDEKWISSSADPTGHFTYLKYQTQSNLVEH